MKFLVVWLLWRYSPTLWSGCSIPFAIALQLLPDFFPKWQFGLVLIGMVVANLATISQEDVGFGDGESMGPKLRQVEILKGWFFCAVMFTLQLQFMSRRVWHAQHRPLFL